MIIWGIGISILSIANIHFLDAIRFALIPVWIAGVGKEIVWDLLLKKGTPEIMDVVYTVTLPSLIALIINLI